MTQAIHSMTKNDAQVIDIAVSSHTYLYPTCEMILNEQKSHFKKGANIVLKS